MRVMFLLEIIIRCCISHIYLIDKPLVTPPCKWFHISITPQVTLLHQLLTTIWKQNLLYYWNQNQ